MNEKWAWFNERGREYWKKNNEQNARREDNGDEKELSAVRETYSGNRSVHACEFLNQWSLQVDPRRVLSVDWDHRRTSIALNICTQIVCLVGTPASHLLVGIAKSRRAAAHRSHTKSSVVANHCLAFATCHALLSNATLGLSGCCERASSRLCIWVVTERCARKQRSTSPGNARYTQPNRFLFFVPRATPATPLRPSFFALSLSPRCSLNSTKRDTTNGRGDDGTNGTGPKQPRFLNSHPITDWAILSANFSDYIDIKNTRFPVDCVIIIIIRCN